MPRFLCFCAALAIVALAGGRASAQATLLTGFGGPADLGLEVPVGTSDDSASLDLTSAFPGGLNFFGTTQTALFANTQGSLTFETSSADVPPFGYLPVIAPFWTEVDTSGAAPATENRVYYHVSSGFIVVTYYRVGYFDGHVDETNTFQVVISAPPPPAGSVGDFDVELRYQHIGWTTTDASSMPFIGFEHSSAEQYLSPFDGIDPFDLVRMTNTGEPGAFLFRSRGGVFRYCGDDTTPDTSVGETCDDMNFVRGDGCNACQDELDLGDPCVDPFACGSGFCEDGVCCLTPCGDCGTCEPGTGFCEIEPDSTECAPGGVDEECSPPTYCDGSFDQCPLPDDTEGDECDLGSCAVGVCEDGFCLFDEDDCGGCPDGQYCTDELTPPTCICVNSELEDGGSIGSDADVPDGGPPRPLRVPAGGGLSCAIGARGASSGASVFGGLAVLAWAATRRRRRR